MIFFAIERHHTIHTSGYRQVSAWPLVLNKTKRLTLQFNCLHPPSKKKSKNVCFFNS